MRSRELMIRVVDRLVSAIRKAAEYNSASQVAPCCILWPDGDRQFESAVPLLLKEMPELLVLGGFDEPNRTGPALWIRCALGGKVEGYDPKGLPPVVYLPGVARSDLRLVETLPEAVRPLAYLAFRGAIFQQRNGKDWTALAFLVSKDGGLGLDVAADGGTKDSLQTALTKILEQTVDELAGGHLDSGDFDKTIAGGDPDRLVLQWLNGGDAWRKQQDETHWKAFMSICKKTYTINPEKDGVGEGLRRLAGRVGVWKNVFERYEESYVAYPQILPNLRLVSAPAFNWFDSEKECGGWPQWNDEEELRLLDAIKGAANEPLAAALKTLKDAEARHGVRRRLLWARMGLSPYAAVIRELVDLAKTSLASVPTCGSVSELSAWYETVGWTVDRAARQAVAKAGKSIATLPVKAVVRNFYKPWLEKTANAFQDIIKQGSYPQTRFPVVSGEGTWCIFADGLRFDTARDLKSVVESKGYAVEESLRWAPVPTITACGKPLAVPGAKCTWQPEDTDDSYDPLKSSGMTFAKFLESNGYTTAKQSVEGKTVWWAVGDIDTAGHDYGEDLPVHIASSMESVLQHIEDAFAAGAKQVRVVTDHGWLWLPGALPKYDLPAGLTKTKSRRYATVKPGVTTCEVEIPWSWNQMDLIAFAPGICCHENGCSYIHGGLSLQECRLVDLTIRPVQAGAGGAVSVKEIGWKGVRFTCALNGDFAGCRVDFRDDPQSVVSLVAGGAKPVSGDGVSKGLIEDEDRMGKSAYLVVLDAADTIKAQNKIYIGGIES